MKNVRFTILAVVFFVLGLCTAFAFNKGTGAKDDPFIIETYADLCSISENCNRGINYGGCYFLQTRDIDCSSKEWTPIGDVKKQKSFWGVYDGGGHTLSNIVCKNQYASVFALLGGEVRNLGIESGLFSGYCVGSLASHGYWEGRIINCYNKATVKGSLRAGGICDNFVGEVWYCFNLGEVISSADAYFAKTKEQAFHAGICSYDAKKIVNCYTPSYALVTHNYKGKIENCKSWVKRGDLAGYVDSVLTKIFDSPQGASAQGASAQGASAQGAVDFVPVIYQNNDISFCASSTKTMDKLAGSNERCVLLFNKYGFNGNGTKDSPYLIENETDFKRFRNSVNYGENYSDVYFLQTADINLHNKPTSSIGDYEDKYDFAGVYDGGGFNIENICVKSKNASLFSYLTGTIQNINIASGFFVGWNAAASLVYVGDKNSSILNCSNNATVVGGSRSSGVVDYTSGDYKQCENTGNVLGQNDYSRLYQFGNFLNDEAIRYDKEDTRNYLVLHTIIVLALFLCLGLAFYYVKQGRSKLLTSGFFEGYAFNLGALFVIFTAFSFCYMQYLVIPQQGWWEYFAQCMWQGKVLYRDVFLPLPPYFTFLVYIFYPLFGSHFFLYTMFVGYPIKLLCLFLCYKGLCKITKPFYAMLGSLFGALMCASLFMDACFDYNPIAMLPYLLVCYLIMRVYENKCKKPYEVLLIGVLVGVILCYKQNYGITIFVVTVAMLVILNIKEWKLPLIKIALLYALGMIVGLLPAFLYFAMTRSFGEFIECFFGVAAAKGGMSGMAEHLAGTLGDINMWVLVTATVFILYKGRLSQISQDKSDTLVQKIADSKNFFAFVCFVWTFELINNFFFVTPSLKAFLTTKYFFILVLLIIATFYFISYNRKHNIIMEQPFFVIAGVLIILASLAYFFFSHTTMYEQMWERFKILVFRRKLILYVSYLFLLIWFIDLIKFFINKLENPATLMFITIIVTILITTTIGSAFWEEMFMFMYAPWVVIYLFNSMCINEKITKIKNVALYFFLVFNIIFCVCSKLYFPYDWQGWRVPALTHTEVNIPLDSMNGLRATPQIARQFVHTVSLIEDYTAPDTPIYQFANIPVFNVITKRNIPVYGPVTWFDVCPDNVALKDTQQLVGNNPKMFIYHLMIEGEWNALERIFRNGKPSGQRQIQKFYNEVVVNNYCLLYEYWNNRDGHIQIWLNTEKDE